MMGSRSLNEEHSQYYSEFMNLQNSAYQNQNNSNSNNNNNNQNEDPSPRPTPTQRYPWTTASQRSLEHQGYFDSRAPFNPLKYQERNRTTLFGEDTYQSSLRYRFIENHGTRVTRAGASTSTTSRRGAGGDCIFCGYSHNLKKTCGGGGGGEGRGSGDDKKDTCKPKRSPSKNPDNGGGCPPGSGSGSGPDPGPPSNAEDPNICPDKCVTSAFFFIIFLSLFCSFGLYMCSSKPSLRECLSSSGFSSCGLNPNMLKHLNHSSKDCRRGKGSSQFKGPGAIPDHLREQFDNFKKALRNRECFQRFSDKCPGLINYAGTMAGGSIESTRNTEHFHNPMLCRCHDPGNSGKLCDPSDDSGSCKECKCEDIEADTLLKEDEKLIAGRCWAFSGVGQVLIGLFFPITITGVTIHHPAKSQILPGFYNSAPKEFEVWGYNDTNDPRPFLFGQYTYRDDGFPSQIFEVQNFTLEPYSKVQFNFLSNYGNKNYTAVYKLEIHGLLDTIKFGEEGEN